MPSLRPTANGGNTMAMITNSFANSSFSLLVGKIQGTIVDYLMPPLSTGELIAGLIGAQLFGYSALGFTYRPPLGSSIAMAVLSYVLSLVSVYVLALIIDALAPTFNGTKNQIHRS